MVSSSCFRVSSASYAWDSIGRPVKESGYWLRFPIPVELSVCVEKVACRRNVLSGCILVLQGGHSDNCSLDYGKYFASLSPQYMRFRKETDKAEDERYKPSVAIINGKARHS